MTWFHSFITFPFEDCKQQHATSTEKMWRLFISRFKYECDLTSYRRIELLFYFYFFQGLCRKVWHHSHCFFLMRWKCLKMVLIPYFWLFFEWLNGKFTQKGQWFSFTSHLYDFLSSVEHKRRNLAECSRCSFPYNKSEWRQNYKKHLKKQSIWPYFHMDYFSSNWSSTVLNSHWCLIWYVTPGFQWMIFLFLTQDYQMAIEDLKSSAQAIWTILWYVFCHFWSLWPTLTYTVW